MFRRLFGKKPREEARPAGSGADAPATDDASRAAAGTGEPEESPEPKEAVDPQVAARRERVCELLVDEYDFDSLATFDLVDGPELYCERLLDANPDWSDTESADRVMEVAMGDAIERAQEEGLPREIAGQRLAAIFVACRTASEWEDLPRAAAVAQDFVASHLAT